MKNFWWIFLCVLCDLSGSSALFAASPELNAIQPRGGQRGQQLVMEFAGDRLEDAQEIIAHEPGIQIIKLESSKNVVKATVQIAADCPLGEHALRVRTATGLSPMRTFSVGALPCLDEKEPNNEFAKPQPISLNCTVHGTIPGEDVDYFSVEAKKGQRLTIELEAMRLGGAFFDAHVTIFDSKRFELVSVDDTPLTGQDPACSVVVPEDGAYIIRVREASYGGAATDQYRMHVGAMPRPMVVYPSGGRFGEEMNVTFLGDALGPVKKSIQLPASAINKHALWFEDPGGICPSPVPFRVNELANVLEQEPNETSAQANAGEAPCAFNGIIEKPKDHDYFRFRAKKGEVFDIRCWARRLGSPLDAVVWISHKEGQFIAGSDDAEGNPDSYLRFTAPEEKEYVIAIRDQLFQGGPNFVYRIEVTPVKPRLMLALQKVVDPPSQERLTVTVPKGNRMAALMAVRRVDCGGEVKLEFRDLPDKLTATSEPVSPGMSVAPVLFEAADDSPTVSKLSDVAAQPTDPKSQFPSRYEQPIVMVTGNNLTVYHTYLSTKLPVIVTETAPFKMQIIEPKAPLLRSGTMLLKVVAERKPEFKGPIRVQPLYNPPGVSAPSEVVMPEGQSEVMLPLTANGGAALGKWKYVVTGVADVGGPMRVSSQLAPIDVAAPFVQIALERSNIEQGKQGTIHGKVTVATPFDGPAKVKLIGLPPKVTAQDIEIAADAKEISFAVTADPTCQPGPIRNLFCQVQMTHQGEPVVQSAGSTELRVDVPLKKAEPTTTAVQAPAKPADTKPLSRLEQLRREQKNKERNKP